ncbi:MAG: hypothetical protein P8Y07_02000 [Gemmatimonadales bacterium]
MSRGPVNPFDPPGPVDVDEEGLQLGSMDAATAARPLRTKRRRDMPGR